jgi:ribose 5-phosphate isomerase A
MASNAEEALKYVRDHTVVGLGSGAAASRFIRTLGERVRGGLKVRGVPTSRASAELAAEVGIPLVTLAEGMPIDVTVDGADEVDPNLDLIKGFGRALVREKIVAAASRQLIILIGPDRVAEKIVSVLGGRGRLPVEVVPFALPLCQKRLADLGLPSQPVRDGAELFSSDNGNPILECEVKAIADPGTLDAQIRAIPGVVGTGLFVAMADAVIVQTGEEVEVRRRP